MLFSREDTMTKIYFEDDGDLNLLKDKADQYPGLRQPGEGAGAQHAR